MRWRDMYFVIIPSGSPHAKFSPLGGGPRGCDPKDRVRPSECLAELRRSARVFNRSVAWPSHSCPLLAASRADQRLTLLTEALAVRSPGGAAIPLFHFRLKSCSSAFSYN